MVTWLVPARIVPLTVPPRVPVPVFTLTVMAVSLDTLVATPEGDLDSTTIEKPGVPAVIF